MPISSGTLLSSTISQIFQAPSNLVLRIATFTNLTSDTHTIIGIWVVKSGDSPSDNNLFFKDIVLPPNESFIIDEERLLLETGDAIYAQADSDDVINFVCSYFPLES